MGKGMTSEFILTVLFLIMAVLVILFAFRQMGII
jgi:cbb3-type cytochrome oxidase subunit 3